MTAQRLFLRRWQVTIGQGQSPNSQTTTQDALTSGNAQEGSAAVDIKFKIKRTLRSDAATCELDVFNLTADHRNQIKTARRPVVQVAAGYKDTGVTVLFNGIGGHVRTIRDNTDWITRIRAADGFVALRTSRVSQSFGANSALSDVVNALANAMGVGTGNASTALQNVTLDQLGSSFVHGTVLHGNAAQELDVLMRSCNLEWSIQERALQILQRGGHLQRQAVSLSPDTGLVGVPEVGNHNTVKCNALLQPDSSLAAVSITDIVSGSYRIETAEYNGDTLADEDWRVELELRAAS